MSVIIKNDIFSNVKDVPNCQVKTSNMYNIDLDEELAHAFNNCAVTPHRLHSINADCHVMQFCRHNIMQSTNSFVTLTQLTRAWKASPYYDHRVTPAEFKQDVQYCTQVTARRELKFKKKRYYAVFMDRKICLDNLRLDLM